MNIWPVFYRLLSWLSKIGRFVIPWLFQVFHKKIQKTPWHFYASIRILGWVMDVLIWKEFVSHNKHTWEIILDSFSKIPWHTFPGFPAFPWHKFYFLTFQDFQNLDNHGYLAPIWLIPFSATNIAFINFYLNYLI